MKTALAFLVLLFSAIVSAETCTVVIRDQYGYDYDSFISTSYSTNAACDDASWNCRQRLSDYQSYGRYYNAFCTIRDVTSSYPPSYPPNYPSYPPSYPNYPSYPPSYPNYPREPREPRDPREPNYPREPRDPREPTYPREPREPRDPREPNFPPRNPRNPINPHEPGNPRNPEPGQGPRR